MIREEAVFRNMGNQRVEVILHKGLKTFTKKPNETIASAE